MAISSYTRRTFAREVLFLLGAAIFCVPVYLVLTVPFKTDRELLSSPLNLPEGFSFDAFAAAWAEAGSNGLGGAMLSSFVITLGSVACLIVVGALGAYAIARHPGRLGTGLYLLFLLGFIVPVQLAVIPLYVLFDRIGLIGSIGGMIMLYTGLLMPMSVFLYTGFLRTLPREYEEAARVDGASQARIFFRIIFPLLLPVTGTVAIMTGMVVWNDFFIPLIFLSGSAYETLPVAVYSFAGEFSSQWNNIFAAVIISVLPILVFYLFAQKQLIRGFSGGVKG